MPKTTIFILGLTVLALVAFAANSVLARLALGEGGIDALAYTGIRLVAGAATLAGLVALRRPAGTRPAIGGSWPGAAMLFGYAIAFSLAYLMLDTATGALVLFASVQFGMLGWAITRGDRPRLLEWAGIVLAFAGLVGLLAPGLTAPDPAGALLMIAAGLCWAAYSMLGRASVSPLVDTAGNFIRCIPVAGLMIVAGLLAQTPDRAGMAYAIASGAIASGLGYAIWYSVLPQLTRTRAAIVQLGVPAIAALGGVLIVGEPLSLRMVVASGVILGGMALAIAGAARRSA
jgi:drug/metabolite transporter (DMT)-like permease